MSRYNYKTLPTALFSLTLFLACHTVQAQTKIGGTAGAGDASAVLELQSTAQGFLHPRMTTTQRDNINTPATGLTIYNTTTNCIQVYKGAANGGWHDLCNTGSGGDLSFTNCSSPVITGTIEEAKATTATIQLNYTNNTGQNFGAFSSGTVNGITLSASGGAVTAITGGSLMLTASGTPAAAGNFNIPIVLAGTACNIPITVIAYQGNIPVACGTAPGCTGGVDPKTAVAGNKICWGGFEYNVVTLGGRLWFDRNLGAQSVATAATGHTASFGDYYQWGRKGDGHQCTIYSNGGSSNGGANPNSTTTTTVSSGPDPNNGGMFILNNSDWISPQDNSLWDNTAIGGVNNPCPPGWRVPATTELTGAMGASTPFSTVLKFPTAGYRLRDNGNMNNVGAGGYTWTNTPPVSGANHPMVAWTTGAGSASSSERASGFNIRCIKH